MLRTFFKLAAGTAFISFSSQSFAQTFVVGQDVTQRRHPEYDPVPVKAGEFDIFPSLNLNASATDNLRASSSNPQGDVYFNLRPELRAQSVWARHALVARAFVDQSLHARLKTENVTTYGGTIDGLYDISRTSQLNLTAGYSRLAESRQDLGSFRGSTKPVIFDQSVARLSGSKVFGRVTAVARASYERRNYHDAVVGSQTFDQDFRDVRSYGGGADLTYDLRNGIGILITGEYDALRHDFREGSAGFVPGVSLNRDSTGFAVLAGVRLELSNLVFGSLQIGYQGRDYKDFRLKNPNGLNIRADILWNPTALTSVRFQASRSTQDSSSTQVAGNVRTDIYVKADHELFRQMIISLAAKHGWFKPNGFGASGTEYYISPELNYKLNRQIAIGSFVRYSRRNSADPNLRYKSLAGVVRLAFSL